MVRITRFGYDHYELNWDLSTGGVIDSHNPLCFNGFSFKSIGGCLKFITKYVGTQYHRCDWCYEEDLDGCGNDGWVLHIIVEKDTMKFATEKMIKRWKRGGKPELVDLLVNVFVEKD